MNNYTKRIKQAIFQGYNLFASFTLSNYLTLVDKKGQPITLEINGINYFFTFNKFHKALNISESSTTFSFYEKLYIANLFESDFKWKNLSLRKFKFFLNKYTPVEPRCFDIEATKDKVNFKVIEQ